MPLGTPTAPSACPDHVRRRANRLGRCLEALRPPLEHHETAELDDLVAKQRGLLELEILRCPLHLPFKILDQTEELVLRQRPSGERSFGFLIDSLDVGDVAQTKA